MPTLGFVLFGSNQLAAADFTLHRIRKYYPESYCMIISDAGADYSELSKRYKTEYLYSQKKLGYPIEPHGWKKNSILEFFDRLYFACLRCETSHIMYAEEDVAILRKLEIRDEDEIIGFQTCYPDGTKFPNGFPEEFINSIHEFSGVRPKILGYGAQGGTVIKVSTLIENYSRIRNYLEGNFDYIQNNIYVKIGWIDCFITWVYLLCGKSYTYNPRFLEHNIDNVPASTELVTAYKKHYL